MAVVRTVLPRKGIIQPQHGDNYEADLDANWLTIDSSLQDAADVQAEVLAENILRQIEGQDLLPKFDGHANCFIESGFGKGLLIDFNYDTEPLPGRFPLPGVGPFTLLEESREIDGFDYVWDQAAFNPIDHGYRCHIHFDFPDGTRLKNAFTYDWRLWNLMELRDVLADAGFSRTEVYWEGTEPGTDEGNGVFKKRQKVENEACWVAYVVAWP